MATGLIRVRSPLLAESLLLSFPPATEMFQFAGFAACGYGFTTGYRIKRWVAPFGHPRITGRSPLPSAFRSVPRPSSPLGTKASTRCPSRAAPAPSPKHTASPCAEIRGQRSEDRQRCRKFWPLRCALRSGICSPGPLRRPQPPADARAPAARIPMLQAQPHPS